MVTISGERKAEHESQQEGYYRLERAFDSFSWSLTLPDGVDPDAVQAHFDRGVLEVRIPKPAQKKPRQVQIAVGTHIADEPTAIGGADTAGSQTSSHKPETAPA